MTATPMVRAVLRQQLACCSLLRLVATPAYSQHTTGSPSGTITIGGNSLEFGNTRTDMDA